MIPYPRFLILGLRAITGAVAAQDRAFTRMEEVIHGDADKLGPIQQAQSVLEKVKAVGGVGQVQTSAGAAHWWNRRESDLGRFVDWFDRQLPARAACL